MKIIIAIVALMASCSSLPQSHATKTTPATTSHKQLQLNIPKEIWKPLYFKDIDERAAVSGLRPLRSYTLPDGDFEVRVWHDLALRGLVGFIFRRANGEWSAMLLDGVSRNNRSRDSPQKLPEPKSGWDACLQRLERVPVKVSVKNEKTGEAITITLGKGDFQRTLNQEKGGTDPVFILSLYYGHYNEWARSALDFRQPRDAEEAIIGPLIDTSLGVTPRGQYLLRNDPAAALLGQWDFDSYLATADILAK